MGEYSTLFVGLELLSVLQHLLPAAPALLLGTVLLPVQVQLFQEQLVVLELSQFPVGTDGRHDGRVGLHVLATFGLAAEDPFDQVHQA